MAKSKPKPEDPGAPARRVAIEAVRRIDEEGAYANLLVPSLLAESDLDERDRGLVTELAYGATRMRRACDWLVDRFMSAPPPPALRAALRVGAYQLVFTRVPAHAAVSATVSAAAKRNRGVVNAVLRKVAADQPIQWPNEPTRLSYPTWIIERLVDDLGEPAAFPMLETMNTAPGVTTRDDGYVQDLASQWVADEVAGAPGHLVLDLCAAPGGKATAIAASGARVVAADVRPHRAGLIAANSDRLGAGLRTLVGDGLAPPFVDGAFDAVLVDAPCSGLGVLRRRADARWNGGSDDVARLAVLQRELLGAAAPLVKPGGALIYSVCTVTRAETDHVAEAFGADHPGFEPLGLLGDRWTPLGAGGRVLPQDHDTDAMAVFRWQRKR